MENDNGFALGYAMGNDSNHNNNGGWGIDGGWGGLIGLLIIASLFGGGWGGGFGFGGGGGMLNGIATRADINAGFQFQDLQNGIRGLTNGLSDSTYALNNSITSGFHGVDRAICDIGYALKDCCCQTQRSIDALGYNMQKSFCDLGNQMHNNTRDIIENQNNGTRAILDFLTQDKIATLTAENQNLKFAASQSRQNDYLTATLDAKTAEILRRTGHDCPVGAYLVQPPTPINFPTNGCGTVQFGYNGFNGGCGYGYGFAA